MELKKGSYKLNKMPNFNYQLNRLILWDGGLLDDVKKVSDSIKTSADWKRVLIKLAEDAENEKRYENAIGYYRMSEFFMYDGDPDKKKYYIKSTDMFYKFYQDYFKNGVVKKYNIPYQGITLPVLYAHPDGKSKGTVLIHGGNDSYIEEFFSILLYFAQKGYDAYVFEGPGQGNVLRIQNKCFTYEWEKPVSAILDFFHLDDVTIIGASLGGMLAPRAAAFEKRIKRVIGWSVFTNFLDIIIGVRPIKVQKIIRFCIKHNFKNLENFLIKMKIKKGDEMLKWAMYHGMYAYDADTPFDYIKKMDSYNIYDIADKVTQDILILGGRNDHMIDYHFAGSEINAFKNARSLTFHMFTDAEDAGAHCNVGNVKLAIDTMTDWIENRTKSL